MEIKIDDLTSSKVKALVAEHLEGMRSMASEAPPESNHALGIEELKKPDVTFWTAWEQDELLGCGALKELDGEHGEIKSMRTVKEHLRKGVASRVLEHIIEEAKRRGYKQLSLETGSMDSFKPAVQLYERAGFRECGPFADYAEDPYSLFMTKPL